MKGGGSPAVDVDRMARRREHERSTPRPPHAHPCLSRCDRSPPPRSKVVATAYPDRRDGVQTPAHTLGDDSLLIKYINPRLFAFATLSPEDAGSGDVAGGSAGALNGKGQELTVSLRDLRHAV